MFRVGKHRSENLQPEVFLIAKAVCPTLYYPDLGVEPLNKTKRWLILLATVLGQAIPVSLDHGCELYERVEPLPFEGFRPVFEELTHPSLALVSPEAVERLLQHVRSVKALVRRQQLRERHPSVLCQVLPVRQQDVPLTLDV